MRVLVVHNSYAQPGGEDVVARMEADLLRSRGHQVEEYWRSNRELARPTARAAALYRAVWSAGAAREVSGLVRRLQPEIVHFHNTWLMISPAAYGAARRPGAATVQTLHNYRFICPAATLLRDGRPCELCKGRVFPLPGVRYACYRGSRLLTALSGTSVAAHRLLGTWRHEVDAFIALTRFARGRFLEAGLPAERLLVKPNFLAEDPGRAEGDGTYALFAGRLSPEKGIDTLLAAWSRLGQRVPLRIVGDGPLAASVRRRAGELRHVEWLGARSRSEVLEVMRHAAFLVLPSVWYEGLPMTLVEAYGLGLPVIASRIGSLEELVADRITGLHFEPASADDLVARVEWWLAHPETHRAMRRRAREEFERRFTAERNYRVLMEIYAQALETRRRSPSS